MIKTAQDAYLAGRQAAMEKLADLGSANATILAHNLGMKGGVGGLLGTAAGTGLGTYLGDQDLRSAGISAAGALGGGQIGSNLALAGINAMAAAKGLSEEELTLVRNTFQNLPALRAQGLNAEEIREFEKLDQKYRDHARNAEYLRAGSNLLGQLAGGAAAGHYTKRG